MPSGVIATLLHAKAGHHRQDKQDRGLADRAVQGHRAAGGARDDGAAAAVEEGGILQSRVAATHGVCPRKGVSVQARYEDTGQTVSRPLQGERLRGAEQARSEEQTSELQSLMRTTYADFCL